MSGIGIEFEIGVRVQMSDSIIMIVGASYFHLLSYEQIDIEDLNTTIPSSIFSPNYYEFSFIPNNHKQLVAFNLI